MREEECAGHRMDGVGGEGTVQALPWAAQMAAWGRTGAKAGLWENNKFGSGQTEF